MMSPRSAAPRDAWALIDAEKRRDRTMRRICVAAWVVTFAILVLFAVMVGASIAPFVRAAAMGEMQWPIMLGMAMPFLGALWTTCLLVAALTTVGVFLRMRAASLSEIQLRLAALEDMLASRGDGERGPEP